MRAETLTIVGFSCPFVTKVEFIAECTINMKFRFYVTKDRQGAGMAWSV